MSIPGLDLEVICEAIARQIKAWLKAGGGKATNVYAFLPNSPQYPYAAVIIPNGQRINYAQTMGPDGTTDFELQVEVGVAANDKTDADRLIARYMSIGQGNSSSIVDAIMSDRHLGYGADGGVDCTCLFATGPGSSDDSGAQIRKATFYLHLLVSKIGANV